MGEARKIKAGLWRACGQLWMHARRDGVATAVAWILRWPARRLLGSGRDPGERTAERFLRALGFRILARNWRSPRDPRDEADLIASTPDGRDVVIVEVKRTAGRWDPLERVDARKRSVLWRILRDLEDSRLHPSDRALSRAIARARRIRIDLVGVRGEGGTASVVDFAPDLMHRELNGSARRSGHPPPDDRPA